MCATATPMGSGYPCSDPARFRVWARDEPQRRAHLRPQHLAKVVRSILAAADLPRWVTDPGEGPRPGRLTPVHTHRASTRPDALTFPYGEAYT